MIWLVLCSCSFKFSISQEPCLERKVYYIASTGVDSEDCLTPGHPDQNHSCASLSYLMQHIHHHATIEIMDDLTLNNTVLLLNSSWSNIAIEGSSVTNQTVTVVCEGSSGILIQNMTGVILENLHFMRLSMLSPTSPLSGSEWGRVGH